jgi:pimeloyl-ACP methyl ester carboxylesterase
MLGGELDQMVPVEAIKETAQAYQAPVRIFSGIGHDLMLEPPWHEVVDCIDEWIRSNVHSNRSGIGPLMHDA